MHLGGTGGAHHRNNFARGCATNNRVINKDNALATNRCRIGIMFHFHTVIPALLGRLDKGAADIVIANDAKLEVNIRRFSIAKCSRYTRVRDRHNQISIGSRFFGKLCANGFAGMIDASPFKNAVWTCKIDIFKNAKPALFGRKWLY